jgi:hypothetical protein
VEVSNVFFEYIASDGKCNLGPRGIVLDTVTAKNDKRRLVYHSPVNNRELSDSFTNDTCISSVSGKMDVTKERVNANILNADRWTVVTQW